MVASAVFVAIGGSRAGAQGGSAAVDPWGNGITPGDYIRVGVGITNPVRSRGAARNWDTGNGFWLGYENWQPGGGGASRVAFGFTAGYSSLPLRTDRFLDEFVPRDSAEVLSAHASHARLLELGLNIRMRLPVPLISPSIVVGLGFLNWAPSDIHYQSTTETDGVVAQQHRNGALLSLGAAFDRAIYGPVGVYAQLDYVYEYTSYGTATSVGAVCGANCDAIKNNAFGTLRAGLRVRVKN